MSAKTRKRSRHPHHDASARTGHRHSPASHPVAHRTDAAQTPVSDTPHRTLPRAQQKPVPRQASEARARPGRYRQVEHQRQMNLLLKIGGIALGSILVLAVIYVLSNPTNGRSQTTGAESGQANQYHFDVASPAAGAMAPDFNLPSTTGGTMHLSDFRGKNVLLYFQEGIGCESCWAQLQDIESDLGRFQQLGITDVVTITTNPLGALKQKVADETITLPVLSDESFAVSNAYNATMYGMMAGSADGHTFILIGPDGRIRWRADYGGPPDYTMYVPISNLIADIKAGMKASANDK